MARQHGASTRRHPRSPLAIDIARLGRRPGAMFTVIDAIACPARIGLDLVAIEPGAALNLDLRVESVSQGVLVSGTVRAATAGECARCLAPTTGNVEIDLIELFAYPDQASEDDDLGRVVDDTVDLEQPIIDAVGLALPLSPLCRADCPGLCPQCGIPLATADSGHHHDQIDPRWAKLATMREAEDRQR